MAANATFTEPWTGTLTHLEWPSTPRLLLLAMINVPVLSIVLNVLWQLVSVPSLFASSSSCKHCAKDTPFEVHTAHGLALDTLPWLRSCVRP